MVESYCQECGSLIVSKRKRIKCNKCKDKDRREYMREYYRFYNKKEPVIEKCAYCGKEFEKKCTTHKYCSHTCRQKHNWNKCKNNKRLIEKAKIKALRENKKRRINKNEDLEKIKKLRLKGYTLMDIALKLGLSYNSVKNYTERYKLRLKDLKIKKVPRAKITKI